MNFGEYVVDINKPPIGPPMRIIHVNWRRKDVETKESKQRTRDWTTYLAARRLAIIENQKIDK